MPKIRTAVIVFLLLFCFCLAPQHVLASLYGRGSYSNCGYSTSCVPIGSGGPGTGTTTPTPTPPVEVTLPSGLEVAINLADGQTIPLNGYDVTMTPLNGQGKSFDHAVIYVDGQQISVVTPDSTGTAHWAWDPRVTPGTDVKIIIFDTNGASVTHEFHVTIGSATDNSSVGATNNALGSAAATASNPVERVAQSIYNGAKKIIKALPKPIVYSFPYILFVLLGVNVFLLLWQARRELREYRILQERLAREQTVAKSKRTLMELVSHYLRTPLTVIRGGIDLLTASGVVASNIVDLDATTKHLSANIEAVIDRMRALDTGPLPTEATTGKRAIWRQPGLFVPLLLIALIVAPFDFLAQRAGSFSASQIALTTQAIVFVILAISLYEVLRARQLRHRNAITLQRIVNEETTTNQTRDAIVDSALTLLQDDIARLDTQVAQMDATPANKFIRTGQTDFHDLLTKLSVAAKLRGGRSTEPYISASITDIYNSAMQSLQPTATAKGLQVTLAAGVPEVAVQNTELLAFALRSLLDNAVAYSPDKAAIEVAASVQGPDTFITVTDHGNGITPGMQANLFQPFSKAEGAEVFTHEGMGFSLYLDTLIMAYLGGSIDLASTEGSGTTVRLRLAQQPTITS